MTATIDSIDTNTSSITFVGPNGFKYSRHVVDPEVFNKVKVGDKVDINWNTDLTVSVVTPSGGRRSTQGDEVLAWVCDAPAPHPWPTGWITLRS